MAVEDPEARAADFLDDRLQTPADLAALDGLLASVTTQHGLLQQQLRAAQRDLDAAKQQAQDDSARLHARAQAFARDHADAARRLRALAASDASDEALPRVESALDALARLDVAVGYAGLLRDVDALGSDADAQLNAPGGAVLAPYKQLRGLYTRLLSRQDAAEGAAPQLLHHVDSITRRLRAAILDTFSADLDRVLKKIRWPSPSAVIPPQLREEWDTAAVKLLDLQLPELQGAADPPGKSPPVLLLLQVLVRPLETRFRYHFEGDRPTNRIDRPEYFLAHVTSLLHDYNGFIVDYVQPVLLQQLRGTPLALSPVCIDAMSAFITAVLPMLRTKIGALLPRVASQPQLLSHLMHELMSFDTSIRETWGYDGGEGLGEWKGLSWEFLVQGDWFGRWLQVEKDFALARYQNIVEAPDFGHLDYESVDPKATKPTKGAIRVNDLLETVTDRYRPLASCSQKLTFLIDIQIAIFDKLHERLQANLEAYLTMTTSLGRAMGSVSKEEQDKLLGIEGLERLCRTFGSADYLEKAMRDWSDDVFFLDIWEGLQDRARQADSIGRMSVADVAERTSKSVGAEDESGALFDETASWYARLRERSEKIIIDTLTSNVREALRPYRHINPWATLSTTSSTSSTPPSPTAELDSLLTYLRTSLTFLSHALAPAPLRRITRAVLATINTVLWDGVLNRHRFSSAGAAQLNADLQAVVRVVDECVGEGVGLVGLRGVLEGGRLIDLPVKGRSGKGKEKAGHGEHAADDDAEENAWDDAWPAANDEDADVDAVAQKPTLSSSNGNSHEQVGLDSSPRHASSGDLGLWEVEKRLFADNQSAREVLDELGFEVLSEVDARALLRRRVEVAG